MARSISSGLQSQIANAANKVSFLLEFNFSTPLRVTSHFTDVTYDSNNYQAGGNFISLESSNEDGEAAVHEIVVAMSNITSDVRDLVSPGNFIDVSVNIYIAFFNDAEALVDATTYFSGFLKSASIHETKTKSEIKLTVADHWSNWNLKKGRHFTDESQQQVFAGDKGLEYADQTKDDIRWGN